MDAEAWDERHRDAELVWSVGPNRWLVEKTVGMPPGRELVVACGEGRSARWLAEQGWQVTATESPRSRSTRPAHSPIRRGFDLDLEVADATEPAPGGSYHLVIVFYLQVEPMV